MVDMFFYRDPEEVEKQQADEAAAKNQSAEVDGGVQTEWEPGPGPQGGAINPALVGQEGGALDWSTEAAGGTTDWSAEPSGAAGWGAEAQNVGNGWD